jgi:FAD/FMN-containing dehydrogenase
LADGRVVDCDEQRHADLFWALRGAGAGQFGVVTSLAFETVPAPAATTFHLVWPAGDAAAVIEAWQHWAPNAPDELNASLRLTADRDRDHALVVSLFGAMLGVESDTVELLDGLVARVGADPEAASHQHLPYRAAKQALVGLGAAEEAEPDRPHVVFSKSEFFRRPLPADTIAALVRALGHRRGRGESRELNFTRLGGAYNRVPADATAFVHRDERYLIEHVLVADPDAPTVGRQWVAQSWATVHRWGSGRVYPNFPDPDLADWAEAYYGGNHERLLRVKRAYDPDNLFCFAEQSL